MSRSFEIEGCTVLWGSIIREEQIDLTTFPDIPADQQEPIISIKELKPFVDQIIQWAESYTSNSDISPIVASNWIITFDPGSSGLGMHTDNDHGGVINVVVWFEGEEGCGGEIVLWDPRWTNHKLWGGNKGSGKYVIPFQRGKVVMLPSSVWHEVTAYTGNTQRRSLNLVLSFKNIKDIVLEDLCTSQLMEVGAKIGYNYTGDLESLFGLIGAIKSKI
jgi:hypothetical protein